MRSATYLSNLFSLLIVVTLLALPTAGAEDAWYPAQIDVWSPPFNTGHQHELQQYIPPGQASRPWRICASIPHLKDDYWLAVNFGLVNEAKRLGVALNLYEAGGYENLATQQSQIAECIAQNKADALIIGAISADGLNSVIADYSAKGMPVIDLINGINSDKITARVAADPLRLGQVFINLLGNAVKFTESGEICLIGELLEQTGNKVKLRFSIRDTGIGMTKEQANRLFQAFSQADASTSRKYGGTGLGLAISKRLVELMGGSIWVVSEPGQGSTFSFTGWFGLSEAAPRRVVPTRLGSLKTLIVDDSASAREVLEDLLTTVGGEIEQVASGAEAIDAVKQADAGDPFDLVLLDWRMPGLDGVETARRIRADGSLKRVPAIVIVTAFGREEVHTEAEGAGVDGFLVKPVN
jgi:CheY-like chemotaxis protein